MNNGREILIFHSPVLITIQFVEGEITHWSNFSVGEYCLLFIDHSVFFSISMKVEH